MLFYASSLYFVAPLARPDGLGVLFCLASITWLFIDDLTPRWFVVGLIFGILALLTKIYLAFPPFLMALYMFLFVSPKRGLIYGLTTVAAAVAALLTMTLFYPAYISMSLVDNMNSSAYYNVDHMKRQTLDWLLYSLPLTVGLVRRSPSSRDEKHARCSGFGVRPSPFAFAAAVNATVFFCVFAGHPGAHMTYMFQLVTPLLHRRALAAFRRAFLGTERSWRSRLPIAFVANAHYFPLTFGRFRAAEATFAQLSDAIRAHHARARVDRGRRTAGACRSAGLRFRSLAVFRRRRHPSTAWPGLVPADAIDGRWNAFLAEIKRGIVEERFDLIIRNRRPGLIPDGLVAAHYDRVATIDVDFPWGAQHWPLDLWEPIR